MATKFALILVAAAALVMPRTASPQAKPDRKKSQAAFQRGKKAEEGGQREEALAAYTQAVIDRKSVV